MNVLINYRRAPLLTDRSHQQVPRSPRKGSAPPKYLQHPAAAAATLCDSDTGALSSG
jgi:hypothetical protein